MSTTESSDRLVIGIDFGTTFSGVAFVYSAKSGAADDIEVIKAWPGGAGLTSDKVPSEIAYASMAKKTSTSTSTSPVADSTMTSSSSSTWTFEELSSTLGSPDSTDQSSSTSEPPRWGYQLRPEEERVKCMKLLLDNRQVLLNQAAQKALQDQLKKANRDAETVVADYLRELWKHTMEILNRNFDEFFIANTKFEIVLTVPAVWSDTAKHATLKAAEKAGMGDNLAMISEPEAAAVYALQAIQPNHMRKGSHFVLCNAGGGTVDLISYEVKEVSPLRILEAAKGSGDCCGSIMINMHFVQFVQDKIGQAKLNAYRKNKPRHWQHTLKVFEENVKRSFDGDTHEVFEIPFAIEDGVTEHVVDEYLTVTADEVKGMFQPAIDRIVALVDGQVAQLRLQGKTADGIVLVGGFGQSSYLYKCLKTRAMQMTPTPVVLQPVQAWTAVVRGAVRRGLEGVELVLSRRSRRNYGVLCVETFIPGLHPPSSKRWEELEQEWVADNRIKWYIRKDQICSTKEPICFDFYLSHSINSSKRHESKLVVCDEDDPPLEYTSGPGSSTRILCTLTTNLNYVPENFWERKTNNQGQQYRQLSFETGMQIESGGLRFDTRVDDVVYGKVSAEFN